MYTAFAISLLINLSLRILNKISPPQAGDDYIGKAIQGLSTGITVVLGSIVGVMLYVN